MNAKSIKVIAGVALIGSAFAFSGGSGSSKVEPVKAKSGAKAKAGRTRYPGITRHARMLGVTYPHLWQVLTGRRASRRLIARYRALLAGRGAA
jgi:hypothetical protein